MEKREWKTKTQRGKSLLSVKLKNSYGKIEAKEKITKRRRSAQRQLQKKRTKTGNKIKENGKENA